MFTATGLAARDRSYPTGRTFTRHEFEDALDLRRVRFRLLSLSRKAAYVQRNGFAASRRVPPDYAQVGVSAGRRRVPFSCPDQSRLPAALGLLSSRLTSLCDMVAPVGKAPSSFAP
jgi:hypothetical protein